ncbi:hypothetical protein [Mycobacterium parmense]|uniref:Uncharacterized protein n=1 Tax=Mycobacterium parmense TaxID=185642 RepID=A0A7I7YX35_9MYCO|nr:hypothetical protein [Mycobacterium parmense]MCV7350726.1 hypothetical protein [Mycobacterium parmense]ORW48419.1 hypothetical protein AWC20_26205 [Mycobacterium parmense]BBZ45847.1 hypothetical protein MPRM_31280 [Mycobacterium parmense]
MQPLRVDTAAVRAMATRWGAAAGELSETVTPAEAGLSCQPSAAAVSAAHAEVAAFIASLAGRVGAHSARVGVADSGYLANEADAVDQMLVVAPRMSGV